METEMKNLKNWMENATKFYITHHEAAVNKTGELSSQECLDQEKANEFGGQIRMAIKLYLKIKKSNRVTAAQRYQIEELPNCQILQEKIDYRYRAQQAAI